MSCLQLVYSGVKPTVPSHEAQRHRRCESDTWNHCSGCEWRVRRGAEQQFDSSRLDRKRSGIEQLGLKDSIEEHDTDLRWCQSDTQLADGMTKKRMWYRILSFLGSPRWKLVLGTTYTSSKQRAKMGIDPLDDLSTA